MKSATRKLASLALVIFLFSLGSCKAKKCDCPKFSEQISPNQNPTEQLAIIEHCS